MYLFIDEKLRLADNVHITVLLFTLNLFNLQSGMLFSYYVKDWQYPLNVNGF